MNKWILSILLLMCTAFALQGHDDDTAYHYISKNVVNMHSQPDRLSEVVSQAIYGTPLNLIEHTEFWVKIQSCDDDYQGWIPKTQLLTRNSPFPNSKHVAQINGMWSHLYWVDDTALHPPAMTLPFETKVEIISEPQDFHNRWIQIRLLDGETLWALRGDIVIDPKPLSMKEMIQLSKRFLGIPFTWAGKSGFGFDCSAFVQTLYKQAGIYIPRDTKDQVNASFAIPINKEDLQPGDLIFFGSKPPKVTHVGMYLGNGEFIHSPATNKGSCCAVQISQLSHAEWYPPYQYITARRYNQ